MNLYARARIERRPRMLLMASVLLSSVAAAEAASPAAQPDSGVDPCSRAISALATPVTIGTPEPASNRVDVSQLVMNFASCYNRRNWDGVLALTDSGFRESMFGVAVPATLRSRLEILDQRGLLPVMHINAIEENGTTGSALATLVITWQGWHDVHRELWRLQRVDGSWRLTGRSIETPHLSGTAVGVRFRIDNDGLVAPLARIINPGIVLLSFENLLEEDMTVLVLAIEVGVSVDGIANACSDRGTRRFDPVGQIQAPTGETVTMPLQELPPGRFAVIAAVDPCSATTPVTPEYIHTLEIAAPLKT